MLESKTVRTADYVEYALRDSSSDAPVFRRAMQCYGFRNLQNVVRRVGCAAGVQVGRGAAGRLAGGLRGANRSTNGVVGTGTAYDYVEVMACPGGCIGGGGQLRPPERKTASDGGDADDGRGFSVLGDSGTGSYGRRTRERWCRRQREEGDPEPPTRRIEYTSKIRLENR